ncbi:MAG: MFS transporter [Pseudomonadales bacterium]|nr:MFS transporter [Pseudomonadales bacterium]
MATGAVSDSEELNFIRKVIDEGGVTRAQILVILIALILNMLDGFDVTAMAFTVHGIGQELEIATGQLGIVFSVALAGMMVGAMFLAPVADILGRRKMIIICVSMIGLSMCATGIATTLWELIFYRAITGLGVGGMLASLAAISAEYTPAKYRSLAVMVITAGYPFGATLGSFIAAPLIPVYGWESVFFAGGLATLAMLILVYFFIPESLQFLLAKRRENSLPQVNAVLARLKRPPLNTLPEIDIQAKKDKANVLSLLTPGRRSRTLTLWASFLFCFMSLYFMMSWIPKLLINAGFSESFSVYAAAAFNGGAVIGIITLGWISARISLSKLIGTYLTTSAAMMIIFAYADGVTHLFPYLIVIGFLLQGGFVGLYAVAAKIYPTELRSTGVGWAIGLGRMGAVLGPYFGGLFIAQGISMEVNFIIFAIPLILSGLIAYTLAVR